MEYPFVVKGEQSVDGHEVILLPPPPIVVKAEPLLPAGASVLDVGAHSGRTGFYLSERGHNVTSLELEETYIQEGQKIARALGKAALRNTFVQGDMTSADLGSSYDAVISTYSLYMVGQAALHNTLGKIQTAAKERGLNVIASYVATPGEKKLAPRRGFFEPNELYRIYKDIGWEVIDEEKDKQHMPMHRSAKGEATFQAYSALIARKPEKRPRSFMNANREIVYLG